jgi:hypothetical protein
MELGVRGWRGYLFYAGVVDKLYAKLLTSRNQPVTDLQAAAAAAVATATTVEQTQQRCTSPIQVAQSVNGLHASLRSKVLRNGQHLGYYSTQQYMCMPYQAGPLPTGRGAMHMNMNVHGQYPCTWTFLWPLHMYMYMNMHGTRRLTSLPLLLAGNHFRVSSSKTICSPTS